MKTPDNTFKTRAKAILNTCIDADCSQLASVLTRSPGHGLKEFILGTLFAQQDELEELATIWCITRARYALSHSLLPYSPIEVVKSTTRIPSASDTPLSTGFNAVVTQVCQPHYIGLISSFIGQEMQ